VGAVRAHDVPLEDPALVAGATAAARDTKLFVLCADLAEYEPLLRDAPGVPSCPLFWLGQLVPHGYARFVQEFDALVGAYLREGYAVVFTARAWALLAALPEPVLVRFLREHVPARYEVVPFGGEGFAAFRLRPRP
jgi:hypothetical protein